MAAVQPILQPLVDEAARCVPGARERLSAAIAQALDPVLAGDPPARQAEVVRTLLADLRTAVQKDSTESRRVEPVLLAAADAVRLAIAARTPTATPTHDQARLPQTALELLAAGALDQLEHTSRVLAEIDGEDATGAQVARLRFYAGLELQEIALLLDMSSNNVRRAWNRVRTRLRA